MDTIFINSGNSKTSEKSKLLILNFTNKLDLRRREKKYCFIKSWYLLYMEKPKKLIQHQ